MLFLAVHVLVAMVAVGAGMATVQRHYEVAQNVPVSIPAGCAAVANGEAHDTCADTLGHEDYGRIGFPTAVWGVAAPFTMLLVLLWLGGALWIDDEEQVGMANLALVALAFVMAAGSAAFLVIGLAIMHKVCALCVTMHALNGALIVLALVSAFMLYAEEVQDRLASPWWIAPVAAALVSYLVAVALLGLLTERTYAHYGALEAKMDTWTGQKFNRAAPPCTSCPSQLVYPAGERPGPGESVVISEGQPGGPILVELLDTGCTACQDFHNSLHDKYERLIAENRVRFEIVLWTPDHKCNALQQGMGHQQSCDGNAAVLCLSQVGPAQSRGRNVLKYLNWEYKRDCQQLPTGEQRCSDGRTKPEGQRRAKVIQLAGPEAGACWDREWRNKQGGLHKQALYKENSLQPFAMGSGRGCGVRDGAHWWCFHATPSILVFRVGAAAPSGGSAQVERLKEMNGTARYDQLRPCLNPN